MQMHEAMQIINGEPTGYMVHISRRDGRFLRSEYFPDKLLGEPLIPTEEEAWELAKKFAAKTVGKYVYIYVVDRDYVPVPGYEFRRITNMIKE